MPVRSRPTLDATLPTPLPGGMDAKIPDSERRGRDAIVVDEWGPFDWKSPKLWPAGRSDVSPLKLRVLGPPGEWQVASVRGATVAPTAGRIPGELTVTPSSAKVPPAAAPMKGPVDWDVRLTYRGGAVDEPAGRRDARRIPYTFGYSRWFVPVDWRVRYYAFDERLAPTTHADAFLRVLAQVAREGGSARPARFHFRAKHR